MVHEPKSASCTPPPPSTRPKMVYCTDRSKAVVPVLVLLFVILWFILRGDLCLTLFYCVLVFFSIFSIAITSLGEERANLSAFRTFVSQCACLDLSVFSSSWCLERAAVCDCGTPWTFLLPFFFTSNRITELLKLHQRTINDLWRFSPRSLLWFTLYSLVICDHSVHFGSFRKFT